MLNDDGRGRGQTCVAGQCTPPRTFRCSNGETDPRSKDTFEDGTPDPQRGTLVCRQATEKRPEGRKPIQLRKNDAGDWHIALEQSTRYTVLKITGAKPKESAAALDAIESDWQVAGFVLSRDTEAKTVGDELLPIVGSLVADVPGGSGVLAVRSLGTTVKTHDKYDALLGMLLGVRLSTEAPVTRVRDDDIARLLGRSPIALTNQPPEFGEPATEFVIRLLAVRRFAFATDPADPGLYPDGSGTPLPVPCVLVPEEQSQVDGFVAPYLQILTGKAPLGSPDTAAIVHFLGGVCGNNCDAQVGHGYLQLVRATQGITIDICQSKLSTSLQEIIHHVIGASSPAVLERVPISTSLAVAVGDQQLLRSRSKGFDYVASANALAFFGLPFPTGAQVVTSYQRWIKQAPID